MKPPYALPFAQGDPSSTQRWKQSKPEPRRVPEVAMLTTGGGSIVEKAAPLRGTSRTSSASAPARKALWRSSTLHDGIDATPPPTVVPGYIVSEAEENNPVLDSSPRGRELVDGLALTFEVAMFFLFAYGRIRRKTCERVRKASSSRLANANKTLAQFVKAAARRHRAMKKAAICLQALARGAAARRCLHRFEHKRACAILVQTRWRAHAAIRECRARKNAALDREAFSSRAAARHHIDFLARRARVVLARWRARTAFHQHQARQTAARHYLGCSARRTRVVLTRWREYAANRRRTKQIAAISPVPPDAFAPGVNGRFSPPPRIEASDLAQAASLDVTGSAVDASGVREANETGGLLVAPEIELEGELRPCQPEKSQAATSKRSSNAEKCRKRRERNRLKREAKGNDRASKAGHKPPAYSSDRFNDKLLNAGRGRASGGVSVGDDAPQGIGEEHSCAVDSSLAPPETTGAVLVEAARKPGRKVWSRKLDRF